MIGKHYRERPGAGLSSAPGRQKQRDPPELSPTAVADVVVAATCSLFDREFLDGYSGKDGAGII